MGLISWLTKKSNKKRITAEQEKSEYSVDPVMIVWRRVGHIYVVEVSVEKAGLG